MTTRAKCIDDSCQDHGQVESTAFSDQGTVFQVFYMINEDQGVEVVETNRIDPEDLIPHLLLGGSIYITPKKHQNKLPT